MATDLQLARRQEPNGRIADRALSLIADRETENLSTCANRAVSKDGRIICSKIVEGDNEVSPNVCRDCPYRAVDCAHLQFSLRLEAASPLVVRYNGRTEIWDDGPAQLRFERAACAAKVLPVYDPRSCIGCSLRQCLGLKAEKRQPLRQAIGNGKVVSFPNREALVATG